MAEFPITLVVTPVTPDEGFLVFVDPPSQTVAQGVVAEFVVTLTGEFAGWIDLTIDGVPEGAIADFSDTPVMVGDTATLTIDTTDMAPGEFPMVVKALAAPE